MIPGLQQVLWLLDMAKASINITSATISKNNLFGKQEKLKYGLYLYTDPEKRQKGLPGETTTNKAIITRFFERKDFTKKFTTFVRDVLSGKTKVKNFTPRFKSWNDVKNADWTLIMQKAYDKARKVFKVQPTSVKYTAESATVRDKNGDIIRKGKPTIYPREQGMITNQLFNSLRGMVKKEK